MSPSDAPRRGIPTWLWLGSSVLAAILVAAVLAVNIGSGSTKQVKRPKDDGFPDRVGVKASEARCGPVERPRYQGRHLSGLNHPPYSSNPPTSGWYLAPVEGFHAQPPHPENAVGSMAVGRVVIWYPSRELNTVLRFSSLVRNDSVVAVPTKTSQNLDNQFVYLTAWGVMQRCAKFSGAAALEFIEEFTDKALWALEPTTKPSPSPAG